MEVTLKVKFLNIMLNLFVFIRDILSKLIL